MPTPTDYARKAVAHWCGLGELSPEVAIIVAAFEKAAPMMAQVVMQGYGTVEILVRDRNKTKVKWLQETMWG